MHLRPLLPLLLLLIGSSTLIVPVSEAQTRWAKQVTPKSSKIRLTTPFEKGELREAVIKRIVKGRYEVDEKRSNKNRVCTVPIQIQEVYRFQFDLTGNTVVISGECKGAGIGGPVWTPIIRGREPKNYRWDQLLTMSYGFEFRTDDREYNTR